MPEAYQMQFLRFRTGNGRAVEKLWRRGRWNLENYATDCPRNRVKSDLFLKRPTPDSPGDRPRRVDVGPVKALSTLGPKFRGEHEPQRGRKEAWPARLRIRQAFASGRCRFRDRVPLVVILLREEFPARAAEPIVEVNRLGVEIARLRLLLRRQGGKHNLKLDFAHGTTRRFPGAAGMTENHASASFGVTSSR